MSRQKWTTMKWLERPFALMLGLTALASLLACGSVSFSAAGSSASPQITTKVSPIDGKTMVLVPAGEFRMGTNVEQKAQLAKDWGINANALTNESPDFSLSLPDFYIDQTPVTNAEYKKFLEVNPNYPVPFVDDSHVQSFNWNKTTRSFPANRDQYPVVLVTWHDALAYCQWAGKHLPTEAEWEKAARGADARLWPWGNEWDTDKANSVEQRNDDATPVGSFPTGMSPYGALDMVGNVWQWTSSLDRTYPYNANDGREDLSAAGLRITRGGAWAFSPVVDRVSLRNHFDPESASLSVGFRCAQ
jgi:toxoflavin biosynthesis protein ToxD